MQKIDILLQDKSLIQGNQLNNKSLFESNNLQFTIYAG